MTNDTVIEVSHVSKKFAKDLSHLMKYGFTDIAKNILGLDTHSEKLRKGEFWAVNNVSFKLKEGESLGIIGLNGSGKTTLLKLLDGIFTPDKGEVRVKGRVGALIAIGAGFHPMLTGRENIYINGTILGMSKKEIDEKFDEIVDFADIGDFLDAPIKTYSSGMFVRLGFAIAVHCEPDILLIDEILSVGDSSFQNKSLRKLNEVRQQAKVVVFVSHNLEHIRNLCDRILILHKGLPVFIGKPHEAIYKYQEIGHKKEANSLKRVRGFDRYLHHSSGDFSFIKGGVLNGSGDEINKIPFGEDITVFYEFQVKKSVEKIVLAASVINPKAICCIWQMSNDQNKTKYYDLSKGKYRLTVKFKKPMLMPGVYSPSISIRSGITGEVYEKVIGYVQPFVIKGKVFSRAQIISPESKWKLKKIEN